MSVTEQGTDREARRRRAALMGVTEEELDAEDFQLFSGVGRAAGGTLQDRLHLSKPGPFNMLATVLRREDSTAHCRMVVTHAAASSQTAVASPVQAPGRATRTRLQRRPRRHARRRCSAYSTPRRCSRRIAYAGCYTLLRMKCCTGVAFQMWSCLQFPQVKSYGCPSQ